MASSCCLHYRSVFQYLPHGDFILQRGLRNPRERMMWETAGWGQAVRVIAWLYRASKDSSTCLLPGPPHTLLHEHLIQQGAGGQVNIFKSWLKHRPHPKCLGMLPKRQILWVDITYSQEFLKCWCLDNIVRHEFVFSPFSFLPCRQVAGLVFDCFGGGMCQG